MTGLVSQPDTPVEMARYRLALAAHPRVELLELDDRAWIQPLLQKNAAWFCQLRWVVVALLGLAGVPGFVPELSLKAGLSASPVWPFSAATLLAVLNLCFTTLARLPDTLIAGGADRLRWLLWAQISTDLLILTAVIHWLGGGFPASPFLYLLHIVLACMVFTPRESLGVIGLAAAFYLGLLLLETSTLLPRSSVLIGVHNASEKTPIFRVAPTLSIWVVIWYLVSRLAETLRSRDRALFLANQQLKASIEERSRHMLQTTHQLKAPFAAIHAQAQLLLGGYCGALPAGARDVTEKLSARCTLLARQIHEMLQLANLRSQAQQSPPSRDICMGALIEEVLQQLEPAVRRRDLRIEKEIHPVTVHGVEDHLKMLVENLVGNAVNYSYDHGALKLSCRVLSHDHVVVSVRDHGIGIAREKLPSIFDDYYRTKEAVQHNRASTGLGLAIVRQVASENSLTIEVESAPGWGTRFTVILPGASALSARNSNPTPTTN